MTALSGKPTFGAGRVFAKAAITNPTPARAFTPQSQSIDMKRKTESLFGDKQLAVAVGAGSLDVTGKVEYGKTSARILADIMLGDAGAAGSSYLEADAEAATVGTAAFVVTAANATNFLGDLGVVNSGTGVVYSRVAAASEVSGVSYSVVETGTNKGKYTFNSSDAASTMALSYYYTNTSAGELVTMSNQLQGQTGAFQAIHVLPWGSEQDMYVLNNCIASSSGISSKIGGFGMSTMEYVAGVDGNGNLGTATFAEVA